MNYIPKKELIQKTIHKIALDIANKAASEDYIEDGGYIRDWLALDIEKALNDVRITTIKECMEIIHEANTEIQSLSILKEKLK